MSGAMTDAVAQCPHAADADGDDRDHAAMPRYFAFLMGDTFPHNDLLSEWLVTLAVAMNDLALVHVKLDEDQECSTGIDSRSPISRRRRSSSSRPRR